MWPNHSLAQPENEFLHLSCDTLQATIANYLRDIIIYWIPTPSSILAELVIVAATSSRKVVVWIEND